MNKKKTFSGVANIDNMEILKDYLEEILSETKVSSDLIFKIKLCFEEIFSNICNYAYYPETGEFEAIIELDENKLKIIIFDTGKPYNPLEKEDPNIRVSVEELPVGGLGIFLTKKFMDKMDYSYKDGKNINTLIKIL